MPRSIWTGAISFGLVTVPVKLYSAVNRKTVRFHQLNQKTGSRIQQRRVDASTGDEVAFEDIVKGYEYEDGHFVTLDKDDFRRANVEATQTVDIVGFVDRHDIAPYYLESPYYHAPGKNGDKGYALLREVLDKQGKVAVATVVIRTRQHIAMVYARHNVQVLNTLRYENELRPTKGLEVPKDLKDAKVQPNEMKMAERLIDDMTIPWDPSRYHDTYRDDLLKMIEEKAAGHTRKMPKARAPKAEIVDFARLLERSLSQIKRGASAAANDEDAGESAPRRPKSAAHRKTASQRARRKTAAPRAHAGHRRAA